MMRHLKGRASIALALVVALATILSAPVVVFAYDPTSGLCSQAQANGGELPAACNPPTINPVTGNDSLIMKAVNIVTIVAGIVAVVMIMIAGTQMILSTGDSAKFAKSRTTLIYIAVGIAIIVLSRTIIAFILNRV